MVCSILLLQESTRKSHFCLLGKQVNVWEEKRVFLHPSYFKESKQPFYTSIFFLMTASFLKGNQALCTRKLLNKPFVFVG